MALDVERVNRIGGKANRKYILPFSVHTFHFLVLLIVNMNYRIVIAVRFSYINNNGKGRC